MGIRRFFIFFAGLICFQTVGFTGPATISPPVQAPQPILKTILPEPTIPGPIPKPISEPFKGIQGGSPKSVGVGPKVIFPTPGQVFWGSLLGGLLIPFGQKDGPEFPLRATGRLLNPLKKGFLVIGSPTLDHFHQRNRENELSRIHPSDPFGDQFSIFNSIPQHLLLKPEVIANWVSKAEKLFEEKGITYKRTTNSSWVPGLDALQIIPDSNGHVWNKRAAITWEQFGTPLYFIPQITERKGGPIGVVKMDTGEPTMAFAFEIFTLSEKASSPAFNHELTHLRGRKARSDGLEVPLGGQVDIGGNAPMLGYIETDNFSYKTHLSFDEPLSYAAMLVNRLSSGPEDYPLPHLFLKSFQDIAILGEQTSRYVVSWAKEMLNRLPEYVQVVVEDLGPEKTGVTLRYVLQYDSGDTFIEIPVQDPEIEEMIIQTHLIKTRKRPYHKWDTDKISQTLKSNEIQIRAYSFERFEHMYEIAETFQKKFIEVLSLIKNNQIEKAKEVAGQFFPLVEQHLTSHQPRR